jgi:hypothetical protein
MSWISKIERAKQHMNELRKEIGTFFATKPYTLGVKVDPKTKRPTYYLVDVKNVPDKISLISGDIMSSTPFVRQFVSIIAPHKLV